MTRYIDAADAAKMMRPLLKRAFPGSKFSVRISRYSMGSSVSVGWTDGPTVAQVDAVVDGFGGARFEGMTDCGYAADSWLCPAHGADVALTRGCDLASNNDVHASRCCAAAELVHFLSGYIHTHRTLSEELVARLSAEVIRKSGLPDSADGHTRLPVGSIFQYGPYDTVLDGVHRLSRDVAVS